MNQKILDSYVEKLYNNQNIGAQIVQQNLYSNIKITKANLLLILA